MKIRPFDPADIRKLRELFEGAAADSPGASLWGDVESEAAVYLYPYLEFEPQSVLVAESDDVLVGYLTGCRDSRAFPSENERMEIAIRKYALYRKGTPVRFFARAAFDLALAAVRRLPTAADFDDPRWPSHLHINVLPRYRGKGVGQALMTAWIEMLRRDVSPGCHLGTLLENKTALDFFQACGFRRLGEPALVPGMRYLGRHVHQIIMVRQFDDR